MVSGIQRWFLFARQARDFLAKEREWLAKRI